MSALKAAAVAVALLLVGGIAVAGIDRPPDVGRTVMRTSSVTLEDGTRVTIENHLVAAPPLQRPKVAGGPTPTTSAAYLVVWAGDWNASDVSSTGGLEHDAASQLPGPDFLAVVDADASSPTYGHVVNTVTVDGLENEPHHMQYTWRQGDRIYAGGLFSDRTFVFDVDDLPVVTIAGVVEPLETPCGSVPDAYWVLSDGTAMGTYMGGPNAAGDPRCNGGFNNGFAGTPGSIVRISPTGNVLGEFPAAGSFLTPHPNDFGRPVECASNPPLPRASCANPHGVQAREDLGVLIASDYAEPRNVPTDPLQPVNQNFFRDTVRVFDISNPGNVALRSVSVMPKGSMAFLPPDVVDPKGVMGIMETTVTNLPGHRGAFASSMCGGQIFYSADITSANPMWRQVFDATAAARHLDADAGRVGGCVGAGWIQTSPDDTVLFQAVIGRSPGTLGPDDSGVPKMVYALDIRDLVAVAPSEWEPDNTAVCTINTEAEVYAGGAEPSCPTVVDAIELTDSTSGGPHWGAIDNFTLDTANPSRLTDVTRIAASDYFVARSGIDGDHEVCMIDVSAAGSFSLDTDFADENTGAACVDFDRAVWPHGAYGSAKPHSMLFVTP